MTALVSLRPPSGALRLCLLGPLELSRADGTSIGSVLAQPKRLALLACLALGGGGGFQRRDVLLNLFWPEFDQERARAALRKALYFLRQSLGEGVIVARGDEELGVDPDRVWCDALAFQAAVGTDRLEDALELYRGDLLPGFFIPDAAEFERWLEAERLRLRLQAARLAATLSERAEAAGNLDEAIRQAQAALVLDALSEPAFRKVVGLLHCQGDRAGVAREYELWRRRLGEEYGIEPSTETQQTVAELLTADRSAREAPWQRSGPLPPGSSEKSTIAVPAHAIEATGSRSAWRLRRGLAWAGALTALAALLTTAVFIRGMPAMKRERVLVAVLENQTGNPALDPVGRMAADWIAHGLMQTGSVEVVSPTSALLAASEEATQGIGWMAEQAGAGTVVSGRYYLEGGDLRFQAQVTDAMRGRLLATLEPISVPVDSATAGAELLRQRVSGALAARFDWPSEWTELTRRPRPPTYAAYAEYVKAWDLFSQHRLALAAEHFERAWALDTTFYLPLLYATLVYRNVEDPARADSILRRVARDRERLAPVERVLLEHFQFALAGDLEAGLRTARQVNRMAPGSMLTGYAYLAVATNHPREVVELHRQIDPERSLLKGQDQYWRWLTTAHHMLGDHRSELREARRARAQRPELLSGLFRETRALVALGRVEEVERLLEESLSYSSQQQVPQPFTPAAVLLHTATELRAHGHPAAAARALEKAIAWYGTRPQEARRPLRPTLARTLYEARRWEEARVLFEELTAEQPGNVTYLGYLGTLAARRGEREEAERISRALASSTQPYLRGAHTLWRAKIAAQLGDAEQALLLLGQALAQGQPYELWLHTDSDLEPLHDHPSYRALVRPKG